MKNNTNYNGIGFVDTINNYGFTKIEKDNKWNFIYKNGKLLSDIWFDRIYDFINGYCKVYLNNKGFNFIDKHGKLIFNKWYDDHYFFNGEYFKNGFAVVYIINKGFNFINLKNEYISNTWFFGASYFKNGYAIVKKASSDCAVSEVTVNFIDINGNFVSDMWFSNVNYFVNGFACVELNNKWNYIDTGGNILMRNWANKTYRFSCNIGKIRDHRNRWNFVDNKGNILFYFGFDFIDDYQNNFFRVELKGRWNYVNSENGNLLLHKWADTASRFEENGAVITYNNDEYNIDSLGNIKHLPYQPIEVIYL